MLTGQAKNPCNCQEIRENTKMPSKDGFIYIIQCTHTAYYKIGITHSGVEKRLQSLQTGCPYKLVLVMMFRSIDPEGDECRIHELCRDCRVRGEWYDFSGVGTMMIGDVAQSILRMMVW